MTTQEFKTQLSKCNSISSLAYLFNKVVKAPKFKSETRKKLENILTKKGYSPVGLTVNAAQILKTTYGIKCNTVKISESQQGTLGQYRGKKISAVCTSTERSGLRTVYIKVVSK